MWVSLEYGAVCLRGTACHGGRNLVSLLLCSGKPRTMCFCLMPKSSISFKSVIQTINKLLTEENPEVFNSSWILGRAPHCYRFIRKNIRTNLGTVDWDRVTCALEWKFQRRWTPGRRMCARAKYRNYGEVKRTLEKYHDKLYVFVSAQDRADRCIRDVLAVSLVRLAQLGNESAKHELLKLLRFTIDHWIEQYYFLACWQGYEKELQMQVEGCIRRYRYSGSFLRYLFRTLEYSGRGRPPLLTFSLSE